MGDAARDTRPRDMHAAKEKACRLPRLAEAIDVEHVKLLDEDTRLRRRVCEILVVSGCKDVKALHWNVVRRSKILERDAAWDKLKELGALKSKMAAGKNGRK